MFTLNQIHEAFSRVKSGSDFPRFVQDLKTAGVTHYDNYVSDGRTVYFGTNGFNLNGNSKYPQIKVCEVSSGEKLKQAIKIHQQGQTDYPTFCIQAADAGVEKWTTDTVQMTVTYSDKKGQILLIESIPDPG